MEEQSGSEWMAYYIDGTPVAYYQTGPYEEDTRLVVSDGVTVGDSRIQWPDGTEVSVQLHHPKGWDPRNGAGSAHDFYLVVQHLLQAAVFGADMDRLWDGVHYLMPDTFRPIVLEEEPEQE